MYIATGSNVSFKHRNGEREIRATCDNNYDAVSAASRLTKAMWYQDKHQYTAAAKEIASAESITGFAWLEQFKP